MDPLHPHIRTDRRVPRMSEGLPSAAGRADEKAEHGRISALRLAKDAVTKRGDAYGTPEKIFGRLAQRWSLTLGCEVTAEQVIICLLDLKIERIIASEPGSESHRDSWVDACGYSACGYEVGLETAK